MSKPAVIAIDGPAGAGKSTVARLVASRLGLTHLDTGATYRLVALRALAEGVPLEDPGAVADLARRVAAHCELAADGTLRYRGAPVGAEIRTPEVGEAASVVASHGPVREVLVALQRRLVPPGGAVIEGRDIAEVVWPQAAVKVFLSAEAAERARRRAAEDGTPPQELAARDRRDATRATAPMRPAPGAVVIDTTGRSPEEVADEIVALAQAANPAAAPPAPLREPLHHSLARRLVRLTAAVLLRTVFRLQVTGQDRIPRAGPAILAPNHRSLVDIPAVAALTRRKVWFMGKEELFRNPLAAAVLRVLGGFPVRRGRPDRRALATALELLRRGELVVVYPEGTRRPDARFDHLEDGLAYLALRSGAPVVPVALSGTEAVFPPSRRLPRPVRIRVAVGEPFSLGGPAAGIIPRARVEQGTEACRARLKAVMATLEP